MKVQHKITTNLGKIRAQEQNLNGYSFLVTAPNEAGKTTFVAAFVQRAQGVFTRTPLTAGAKKGADEITFTDGRRLVWSFSPSGDKMSLFLPDGEPAPGSFFKNHAKGIFGEPFDIDAFIRMPASKRRKELQVLADVPVAQIEQVEVQITNWQAAQTEAQNRYDTKVAEYNALIAPPVATEPTETTETLLKQLKDTQENNSKAEKDYDTELRAVRVKNEQIATARESAIQALSTLIQLGAITGPSEIVVKFDKEPTAPTLTPTAAIEKELSEITAKHTAWAAHNTHLTKVSEITTAGTRAKDDVQAAKNELTKLRAEKSKLVSSGKLPDGFSISETDILYNGEPLEALSLSRKYIAALKLGALKLGELRYMHFEGSALDNDSLNDVLDWAQENDIQLAVELPSRKSKDFEIEVYEPEAD